MDNGVFLLEKASRNVAAEPIRPLQTNSPAANNPAAASTPKPNTNNSDLAEISAEAYELARTDTLKADLQLSAANTLRAQQQIAATDTLREQQKIAAADFQKVTFDIRTNEILKNQTGNLTGIQTNDIQPNNVTGEPRPETNLQPSTGLEPRRVTGTELNEPETQTPRETMFPQNTETDQNQLNQQQAQVNNNLNNPVEQSGVNVAAGRNYEFAPETTRNEQQTLLQQVGSQLAQALPPASIISVLG